MRIREVGCAHLHAVVVFEAPRHHHTTPTVTYKELDNTRLTPHRTFTQLSCSKRRAITTGSALPSRLLCGEQVGVEVGRDVGVGVGVGVSESVYMYVLV